MPLSGPHSESQRLTELSDRVSEHKEMLRGCGQYNNFKAGYDSLSQEGRARTADWKSLKKEQKIE